MEITTYLPSTNPTTILLLLFLLLNLKVLPLSWHMRLLYRVLTNWHSSPKIQQSLSQHHQPASSTKNPNKHPLFHPVTIKTHTPALETDYNFHKSNATFFSDLDESRTALVTKIYGSKWTEIDREEGSPKGKGRIGLILGSVHTSFHREIRPYQRYEVRSRVLGWDRKWLVIVSYFVVGKDKVMASSLSKYVVKKGRLTVAPETCLRRVGWVPEAPLEEDGHTPGKDVEEREVRLRRNAETDDEEDGKGWDWNRIEMERIRGLKIAEKWMALDQDLMEEFSSG